MPRRVTDGLKRELREKLYIYENNLMNGGRLDPEVHSWKKALTLTNILLKEQEKEIFPMEVNLIENHSSKEQKGRVTLEAKAVATKTHNLKMPGIMKEEPEAEMEEAEVQAPELEDTGMEK